MRANERAAPVITPTAARDSRSSTRPNLALIQGGKQHRDIAPGWEWLHRLREGGLVPQSHFVRVTLDCSFDAADALPLPKGNLASFDFAMVAGLDVFIIFDSTSASGHRLLACSTALLSAGAESLRLADLAERRLIATLKVGHEEVGRWRPD